jgi:hypothetical protein
MTFPRARGKVSFVKVREFGFAVLARRSQHADELALALGVAVDVSLRCFDWLVTGKQLYVAQAASRQMHFFSGGGDKSASA